ERLGLEAPLGSIDRSRLNVNGGSLGCGHPFAATGGRLLASLAKAIDQRGGGRGLISVCAAGGLGVTAIVEK
ncbi:acetyl-CoA acetyltransferase, partial [Pseudomonas asplenii]